MQPMSVDFSGQRHIKQLKILLKRKESKGDQLNCLFDGFHPTVVFFVFKNDLLSSNMR